MATAHPWNGRRRKSRRDDHLEELDPVFHALSLINGKINRMNKSQLQKRLEAVGLNSNGVVEVLRKRLKNYHKRRKIQTLPELTETGPSHLVVIDYEATCEEPSPPDHVHEIIEFPAILIDRKSSTVLDEFHSYCKPTLNPILTPFCTGLTGIKQEQVDGADHFSVVLNNFEDWLAKHDLHHGKRCLFVTDGRWDFSGFLHVQCRLSDLRYPKWAKKWTNLKKVYCNFYKLKKPRIMDMLDNLGMEFEGRLHCGLDDARNLARIVVRLAQDGATFQPNERLVDGRFQPIMGKEMSHMSASASNTRKGGSPHGESDNPLVEDAPTSDQDESCVGAHEDESCITAVTHELKSLATL